MKRIIIGVIACICAITVMAQVQTHDVKGIVFDRKQQPIVGALVTAKGTNISTITDVDGKFFLQEVPLHFFCKQCKLHLHQDALHNGQRP